MNSAAVVALLNVTALVTIMLAMGMQVKFEAVTASVRPLHRVSLGLIANYALVPAVTVGLLLLFKAEAMVSAQCATSSARSASTMTRAFGSVPE